MSDERLGIFSITLKFRQSYRSIVDHALDINQANDMCLKNLHYILRVQMSDERFYRPSTGEITTVGDVGAAKLNFAKLYKQCDVLDNLPSPALGIVRTSFPMAPHPIPLETRTTLRETLQRQRSVAIDTLRTICSSFVVYVSNFGITQTLSLPTLSIILPDLTTQPALTAIARIKEIFDPFNFSLMLIRFSLGEFKRVGEIWHYPRVPLGSSISGGGDDTAGTVGGFCWNSESDDMYALTAAHLGTAENGDVFTPASKPFNEATRSLTIRVKDAAKAGRDDKSWGQKLQDLQDLNRLYGKSIFSSQKCTDDGRIIDCALVKVERSRTADNRVAKLPEFSE